MFDDSSGLRVCEQKSHFVEDQARVWEDRSTALKADRTTMS
jgi:hypothetical protein